MNVTYAGPVPDDNITLERADAAVKTLALLFPLYPATIWVFGPTQQSSYPTGGNTKLGDAITDEAGLLAAGVDPATDPVEVSFKLANVAAPVQNGAAVCRQLDRGGENNFAVLCMSIFGRDTNVEMLKMQTLLTLAKNDATRGKTLQQVMQGK